MIDLIACAITMCIVGKMIGSNKPVLLNLSKRACSAGEVSICRTCACSLIQKDSNGEEVISCTYGGRLNPVSFVVIECSGWEGRHVERPERVAGFVAPARCARDNVTVIRIACESKLNQLIL